MIHNTIQGQLTGQGLKIAIVTGRFNAFITDKLLDGCVDTLARHGVEREDIAVFWVPGAFEISFCAKKLMDLQRFDAIICLGAVIRGSTPHFDYVAGECAKGLGHLNLQGQIPVIFGVLTTDTIEQAIERAGTKAGNKGADCAVSAIEMANLTRAITAFETPVTAAKSTRTRKTTR